MDSRGGDRFNVHNNPSRNTQESQQIGSSGSVNGYSSPNNIHPGRGRQESQDNRGRANINDYNSPSSGQTHGGTVLSSQSNVDEVAISGYNGPQADQSQTRFRQNSHGDAPVANNQGQRHLSQDDRVRGSNTDYNAPIANAQERNHAFQSNGARSGDNGHRPQPASQGRHDDVPQDLQRGAVSENDYSAPASHQSQERFQQRENGLDLPGYNGLSGDRSANSFGNGDHANNRIEWEKNRIITIFRKQW